MLSMEDDGHLDTWYYEDGSFYDPDGVSDETVESIVNEMVDYMRENGMFDDNDDDDGDDNAVDDQSWYYEDNEITVESDEFEQPDVENLAVIFGE